jgi:hypothetical protein
MSTLEENFRKLRKAWFSQNLKSYAHVGIWYSEKDEERRIKSNSKLEEEFDKDTEDLILGKKCAIAPTCHNDMYVAKRKDDEELPF